MIINNMELTSFATPHKGRYLLTVKYRELGSRVWKWKRKVVDAKTDKQASKIAELLASNIASGKVDTRSRAELKASAEQEAEETKRNATIADYILNSYIPDLKQRGKSSGTIQGYRQAVTSYYKSIAHLPIAEITKSQTKAWREELIAKGTLGNSTINKQVKSLRFAVNHAIKNELRTLPYPTIEPLPEQASATFEAAQEALESGLPELLWAKAEALGDRHLLAILGGTDLGLRVGEITALHRSQLDLTPTPGYPHGTIRVRTQRNPRGDIEPTKMRTDVTLRLTERIRKVIDRMPQHDHGFLLDARNDSGQPIGYRAVQALVGEVFEAAGLDHGRTHILKHIFDSAAVEACNGDCKKAAKLTRHGDPEVLARRYQHHTKQQIAEVGAAVETLYETKYGKAS